MLIKIITKNGKRDILTPNFSFKEIKKLDDEIIFDEIVKLRYLVYCKECQYLNENDYEDEKELDEYDSRSIHFVAENENKEVVGTIRLILANQSENFPFEKHCEIFPSVVLPNKKDCGEISRFIIKKEYRKNYLHKKNKNIRTKYSQQIMLGLYREMYRYSVKNNIRFWFAAMEKGLAKLLLNMGFKFEPMGPEMDYYGPVTIYVADLRNLESFLNTHNLLLLKWFQGEKISNTLLIKTIFKYKFSSRKKNVRNIKF